MVDVSGAYAAACLLLALAGAWKLAAPDPSVRALASVGLPSGPGAVRILGAGEVALGLGALASWWWWTAGLVAVTYLGFAGFVLALRFRPEEGSCGCFGASATPPSLVHVGLDLALAGTSLAVALGPGTRPALSLSLLVTAVLLAWLLYLAMTELPRTLALVRS